MGLRVIVFGGSGMVGAAALQACLDDAGVEAVLAVGRRPSAFSHPKLKELLLPDLFKLEEARGQLQGYQACLWCLGTSSIGQSEADFAKVNHELPLKAARLLLELNPDLAFCYVSGAGLDARRQMWSRVKGRSEDELLALPFRAAVMFRLGGLIALKGHGPSGLYRWLYPAAAPLMILFNRLSPAWMMRPEVLGRAFLAAARGLATKPRLDPPDIAALGA